MDEKELPNPARYFFASLFFLFLVLFVQAAASSFMEGAIDGWFLSLKKPSWNPPGWVFGLIWPVLYILIAFVGYLLWAAPSSKERSLGLVFWFLQLFFNNMWTYFFFALQSPFLGFVDILLTIFLSVCVMVYGRKVHPWIAFSFLPYVLWLSYAGVLNFMIYYMNSL